MKYIIDVPDDAEWIQVCKRAEGGVLNEKVIYHSDFMPYTEPDRKAIEDEVWCLARIIETMSVGEITNIFGIQEETVPFICNALTYQEAQSKYEEWLKQKEEIHVGDEVTYTSCGDTVTFIVLGKKKNKYYGFIPNAPDYDDVGEYCDADMLKKTGRHFPEIVDLLEKIRGDEE